MVFMMDDKSERRRKLALKLTWFSAISFLIGGSWAWFIVSEGGPEALGAIGPMIAVGAIHILLGPIAVLYAFKSPQFKKKKYIYVYFVFYFIATIVILSYEAIVYSVLFFVAVITPLLFSVIASLIRGAKGQ
jgi:4-amino-4-deoxy-L-arabinose transferase-like glycosyltransferase